VPKGPAGPRQAAPQDLTRWTWEDNFNLFSWNTPAAVASERHTDTEGYLPDRRYWLNYFFHELRRVMLDHKERLLPRRDRLLALLNRMFTRPNVPRGEAAYMPTKLVGDMPGAEVFAERAAHLREQAEARDRGEVQERALAPQAALIPARFNDALMTAGDTEFRELLLEILDLGWSQKALAGRTLSRDIGLYSLMDFQLKIKRKTTDFRVTRLWFGWRGEKRPLQQILKQGCSRKVDRDQDFLREYNLNADWHPFSLPEIRGCFWYREGQNDNCLYTAVSGALNFPTAVCNPTLTARNYPDFPFADLAAICRTPKGNLQNLAAALEADARIRPYLCTVKYEDGTSGPALYTRVTIALFLTQGWILKTSEVQEARKSESYPEMALEKVPGENFYGLLEVLRVHPLDDLNLSDLPFVMYIVAEARNDQFQERLNAYAEHIRVANGEQIEQEWRTAKEMEGHLITWKGAGGFRAARHKRPMARVTTADGVVYPPPGGSRVRESRMFSPT
jgi:hypothetical protein